MTKELRSEKMRFMLESGIRRARRNRRLRPGDGMMTNLLHETLKNGWHYQVEWVHDTRFAPEPWDIVYAFHPRKHQGKATHWLKRDAVR